MKLKLVITVDTNDADWVTGVSDITEARLALMKPIFEAIKGKGLPHHNWPLGECANDGELEKLYEGILTEEQLEAFRDWAPNCEYGFHTVEGIAVLYVEHEEELL